MFQCSKIILLFCVLRYNYAAVRLPPSPCPQVFAYEGELEADRWYGVITFSSNIELVGLNYKVQLDRPSQLLVSWDGEVRTDDNINYSVFDPFHTQMAGEVIKARIMVKFNPRNGIPGISRIVINGNTMCLVHDGSSGSAVGLGFNGETTTTERFDPSFNENEDAGSEYSSNRGQSNNNNPNYNNANSPNSVNYRPNAPNYSGGGGNAPNYNQNGGSNGVGYGNSNSGPVVPVYPSNSQTSGSHSNTNYAATEGTGYNSHANNPNYGSADGVSYPTGNRPQWSADTSTGNRTTGGNNWQNAPNTGSAFSNSAVSGNAPNHQTDASTPNNNNGPVVTTLTLPNGMQNNKSNNIDQIVQIIKNQLEMQQFASSPNKTFIVAVVNPSPVVSSATQINTSSTSITSEPNEYLQRATSTSSSTTTQGNKVVNSKVTSSTIKTSNGHRTR